MSKTILYIFLAVLTVVTFGAIEAKAIEPNDAALRYFEALQNGNINTIKDSIMGDLYKKRKILLDQNANYPEFLKNIYQGAEFQITKTTPQGNNAVVNVNVNFPDRQKDFTLFLKKDDMGNWKIFKEISD